MRPSKILKDFLDRVRGWVISMTDKDVNKENNEEGKEKESGKEQKVQFPQYFQQKKNDNPNSTSLKTPVMRGVVVSEFDGNRIWVEASGNMKGRYGVEIPNGYNPEDFTPGTEVALDPNTFKVTDIVEKGKDAEFDAIETDVTFQDIGGLDHVVKSLKSNVGAQLNEDKSQKMREWGIEMDKSMLLVGKPGTGKTHLVKALSNEYDADMFMINGPQMVEKFIGEGAKKVKRLYDQARASEKPAIVFIDEIDAIAKKRLDDRRHGGEEVERTMSQLLSELDGLDTEKDSGVISIFATNTPDIMDPALLNRCSAIEVPVPDTESKEEILRIHTRRMKVADDVNYTAIAGQFEEGFTGRDIKQIAKQAAVNTLEKNEDVSEAEIEMEDFESAIKDLKEGNMGVEKDFLSDGNIHPNEMFA